MKVCLVSSYYPPYVGGIETYTSNLAGSLVSRGHEVTVYCSSQRSTSGESLENGVKVVRFRTPLVLYGAPLGPFPLSFAGQDCDVIHCGFPNPWFAAASAWTAGLKGVPSILTWHNDLPAVAPAASLLVRVHDRLSPSYLAFYSNIVATTSVYIQRSKTLQRYSKKVKVVLNGVDADRFRPGLDGGRIRDKFGLKSAFVILFVGALTRWHAYKGLDVLVRSFAQFSAQNPDARLLIVGGGELLDQYRRLATQFGVGDKVVFAGYVDNSVLPLFYAASDVTVLPSKDASEGFGLVLLEAMASGKAVVGTSVGGIPELVRNGENGLLVPPGDPNELSLAISALRRNDEGRFRMGIEGRKFAEMHDWSVVASRMEAIYAEAAPLH